MFIIQYQYRYTNISQYIVQPHIRQFKELKEKCCKLVSGCEQYYPELEARFGKSTGNSSSRDLLAYSAYLRRSNPSLADYLGWML